MPIQIKRYKLKLNSAEKIEELLQELYNETCKNINDIQMQMNKLAESTPLTDEIMDSKAKFAKAMNDFIANKDKAIGRKLEIAKLMAEVYKFQGNVAQAVNEGNYTFSNFEELKQRLLEEEQTEQEPATYKL